MEKTLSRQALYDLVWAEPLRTVAQRYGMSDVAFKKYCVRANVPVPDRGYWAKLAAGKPASRFPLPPRDAGSSDHVRIGGHDYRNTRWDPAKELAKPPPEPPVFPEDLETVRKRSGRRLGAVKIARGLESPCTASESSCRRKPGAWRRSAPNPTPSSGRNRYSTAASRSGA